MRRLAARKGRGGGLRRLVARRGGTVAAAAAVRAGRLRRLLVDVGELEELLEIALRLEVSDVPAATAAAAAALRLKALLRCAETSDNDRGGAVRAEEEGGGEREISLRGIVAARGVGGPAMQRS